MLVLTLQATSETMSLRCFCVHYGIGNRCTNARLHDIVTHLYDKMSTTDY